ncbi:MAG: prepilin peptidase [Campylobacterales bacterium]|nr:prepilin peptidase [Campylobacterales bacterium]
MEFIIVSLFGLFVGSFLNVVIYRVPLGLSIISPRSSCQSCKTPIAWYHNIPVVSWLLLRGKSACCNEPVSIQYPLVELATMVIFVSVFLKSGYSLHSLWLGVVFSLFLALSVMDYHHHEIHDSVSLTLLSASFFADSPLVTFQNALLFMGGMSMLRFYVSFATKKEAMGEGDIIIGGAMAAILGIKPAIVALFAAALIAIPFVYFTRHQNRQVPFVPFLFLGVFAVYMADEYAGLFWRMSELL